jgi:hypothetical protein
MGLQFLSLFHPRLSRSLYVGSVEYLRRSGYLKAAAWSACAWVTKIG